METIKATKCDSTEKKTIPCKSSGCCMAPDAVSGFENKPMNVLLPRLDLDLLTRADAPMGISIVAPRDNKSGWELIEITVGSGACDTVLQSKMLSSIRTDCTEASRAGEEYEVANGQAILNEGQKR